MTAPPSPPASPSRPSPPPPPSAPSAAPGRRFADWQPPEFDARGMTKWNWMCQHPQNLRLGRNTDIGAFCYLNALHGLTIEEEVQVGSHCSIYTVSTIDGKAGPVVLRRNCRIGSHTTIMPGVTVGENAIVGAHSFVDKDVPAGCVAFGVPARVRKEAPK